MQPLSLTTNGRQLPSGPLAVPLLLLLPLLLSLPPCQVLAKAPVDSLRHLEIRRATAAIVVDGVLDDPGWQGAARTGGFVEIQPGDSTPPPVETEVLVTYDDTYLYVGFRCFDDPDAVRATHAERDRIFADDLVGIMLDPFDGQQWAYEIFVNPCGVPGDILWNAGAGEDTGFDMIFDSAARVTADGWTAELAIPFASLRFPEGDEQTWRVDFFRIRPREVRTQMSWVPVDRDDACWPCQWGYLHGLSGLRRQAGLELLPVFVARESGRRLDDGSFHDGEILGDVSLGAKVTLSSSATAEATWNPDFSQVESDAAQIDVNTTFALWYPERRPFFQEGSDLWRSYFNVVHTRSVNDPRFAGKLTARRGDDSAALLVARDRHTPLLVPLEERSRLVAAGESDVLVGRLRHALGDGSYVGVVGTGRWLDGDGSGVTAGVDGCWRLSDTDQLAWQLLGSRTEEPRLEETGDDLFDRGRHTVALDGETFSGHALFAALEHEGRHLYLKADYRQLGPTFRADVGFEPSNDRREGHLFVGWTERHDAGPVTRWRPLVMLGKQWNIDGTAKDEWIWSGLSASFSWAQADVQLSHMRSDELFGGVHFRGIFATNLEGSCKPSDAVSLGFWLSAGHRIARRDLVMGRERSLALWSSVKPWSRLVVETTFNGVRSDDLATGERLFDGYVARSRWSLQLSRELSVRLVVQYDDFAREWQVDPLVTYRLNPFSIFYVGATHRFQDYDDTAPLPGWRLGERQYFLKLQYLWRV